MRRIIHYIFCILVLSSCGAKHRDEKKTGLLSNFLSITDNEDKGIKEVLSFYGGECEYSVGFSKSNGNNNGKFFEMALRKSKVLEQQADISEMPASNIAYRFYKNLKDERAKYNYIKVVIDFENGGKQTFKYNCQDLKNVEDKLPIADSLVSLIKLKNFQVLKNILNNNSVYTYDKNEYISNLEKAESEFGNITEGFRFLGFTVKKLDGIELLHLSGVIVRDKQNTNISMDIDWNKDLNNLYLLQYKL
jgi:hypothetical protein